MIEWSNMQWDRQGKFIALYSKDHVFIIDVENNEEKKENRFVINKCNTCIE